VACYPPARPPSEPFSLQNKTLGNSPSFNPETVMNCNIFFVAPLGAGWSEISTVNYGKKRTRLINLNHEVFFLVFVVVCSFFRFEGFPCRLVFVCCLATSPLAA